MRKFFRLTKVKIIYLIAIGLMIIVSGVLAQRIIYCIRAPCPQPISTIIGQGVYNVLTFNRLLINSGLAIDFKNLLEPILSAGWSYLIFSFVISIILHYLIISLIMFGYHYLKKRIRKSRK